MADNDDYLNGLLRYNFGDEYVMLKCEMKHLYKIPVNMRGYISPDGSAIKRTQSGGFITPCLLMVIEEGCPVGPVGTLFNMFSEALIPVDVMSPETIELAKLLYGKD